jgi:hypothetical protein
MTPITTKEQQQPPKWKVIFSGCNHSAIMSEMELANPIETQFNPEKLLKEDVYVCPRCANGERGFCMNSVLHPILTATKLTPLDNRRMISF